ncbi:hypothetical protein BGZ68_008027, partial [Mortierella alpina]
RFRRALWTMELGHRYHQRQHLRSPLGTPPGFVFRDDDVQPIVRAAQLPSGLQADVKDYIKNRPSGDQHSLHAWDLAHFLSQSHLQYLYTRFLSPTYNPNSRLTLATDTTHPEWKISAEVIQHQQSDNLELTKANEGISATILEHIREYSTAVDNLWTGSIFEKGEKRTRRWSVITACISKQLRCKPAVTPKDLPGIEEQLQQLKGQDSDTAMDESAEPCVPKDPEDQDERGVDDDLDNLGDSDETDDDEEDSEDSSVQASEKETPAARIRALLAIAKMLVQSDSVTTDVDIAWVRRSSFRRTQFTDKECQAVVDIVNAFRAYVPSVRDLNGSPLTNTEDVTRVAGNKQAIFAQFFDLAEIDRFCRAHGLQFNMRISFADELTIRLTGKVIAHNEDGRSGYPVTSAYEQRKKDRKGRTGDQKWSHEWLTIQDDYEDYQQALAYVQVQLDSAETRKKNEESILKALRKQLKRTQMTQTMARQGSDYERLKDARLQTRAER